MNLVDYKTQNGPFTWTNMRKVFFQIMERLDHFLVSENWFSFNLEFCSSVVPYTGSDHFPILFSILEDKTPQKLPFKFEPMWFRDQSFLPLLKIGGFLPLMWRDLGCIRFLKSLVISKEELGNGIVFILIIFLERRLGYRVKLQR